MRSSALPIGLVLLLAVLPGASVRADDVYLTNGRSFTGVVAEVTPTQVRILLPGGAISLARGAVDRVEKSETNLSDYLARKEEILAREKHGSRNAADWLELARWARAAGFSQGAREAALEAATVDPRQPGLAPVLRPLGYVYDDHLDRWIPYGDSMRLHGFIEVNGQWLSPQEAQLAQNDRLQVQTAMAAQAAAAAATEARDIALLQAQAALGQAGGGGYVSPYDTSGSIVGGYYGSVYWPRGYGGIFSVPGRGFRGSFGFPGQLVSPLAPREHHGAGSGRALPPAVSHFTSGVSPARPSGVRH